MKIIHDNEPFGKHEGDRRLQHLTPNQMFEINPTRLLWLHLNCTGFTFTDGIRKKLNEFKKKNKGIANTLKISNKKTI